MLYYFWNTRQWPNSRIQAILCATYHCQNPTELKYIQFMFLVFIIRWYIYRKQIHTKASSSFNSHFHNLSVDVQNLQSLTFHSSLMQCTQKSIYQLIYALQTLHEEVSFRSTHSFSCSRNSPLLMQSESALPPSHKRLKLGLTLSKFNLVHILTEYFLKTHFNGANSCLRSPKFPLSFKILWLKFLMFFSNIIHFIWSSLLTHSDEHKLWHSLPYNCLCP